MSLLCILLLTLVPTCVLGHGRMREPPSRSSMWRDGFNNPANYNDNELFCGGFNYQVNLGGKCGVCGDPWDKPREHEAGGKYANGIIARNYEQGGKMDVAIQITAHHKGYFEFRLCPNNNPKVAVTEECLNKYLLPLADGSGTRYMLPDNGNTYYNMTFVLPPDVTCTQCVLQWKYMTGNSWGTDENGKGCIGCGPQEQFYGCSDIAIKATKPSPKPKIDSPTTDKPATKPQPTTKMSSSETKQPKTEEPATKKPISEKPATKQPNTEMPATKQPTTEMPATKQPTTEKPATKQPTTTAQLASTATNKPTTEKPATKQPSSTTKQNPSTSGPTTPATETTTKMRGSTELTCKPTATYKKIPVMAQWCERNCPLGFCPKTHCVCEEIQPVKRRLAKIISRIISRSSTALPSSSIRVSRSTARTSGTTAKPTRTSRGTTRSSRSTQMA